MRNTNGFFSIPTPLHNMRIYPVSFKAEMPFVLGAVITYALVTRLHNKYQVNSKAIFNTLEQLEEAQQKKKK